MLLCAYRDNAGDRQQGVVESETVYRLEGDMFWGSAAPGERVGTLKDVNWLPPVIPRKIVCVGRNYVAHAQERGEEVPTEPLIFLKPTSALIAHAQEIQLLPDMGRVDHEAELAVVMGRQGRFIPRKDALRHVLGYTCGNDVSARDFQAKDGQWSRAKGFDTFCPLGSWINTDCDPADLLVRCLVNGEERQSGRTSEMVFDVSFLIWHISRIMTLEIGDVILTGTPAGVSPLHPGDTVEVSIEGIGSLRNTVALLSPPRVEEK